MIESDDEEMGEQHPLLDAWVGGSPVPEPEPVGDAEGIPPPPPPPPAAARFSPAGDAWEPGGTIKSLWARYRLAATISVVVLVCGLMLMKLLGPGGTTPADAAASPAPAGTPSSSLTARAPDSGRIQVIRKPAPTPATKPASPELFTTPTPPPLTNDNPFGVDEDLVKKRKLLSQLRLLRSKIGLYKLQHGDRPPELSSYQWGQLTGRTRSDGTPAADGPLGPYLEAPPVNALNGFGAVGMVRRIPAAREVLGAESMGFVYCAATGEIAAIDKDGKTVFDEVAAKNVNFTPRKRGSVKRRPAVALPKRDAAARTPAKAPAHARKQAQAQAQARAQAEQEADRAYLVAILKVLRQQIELYTEEHYDRQPDFARYPAWQQLLRRTYRGGMPITATTAQDEWFGPYLLQTPTNPLNDYSFVETVTHFSTYRPQPGIGFVFETSTGNLYATDATGSILEE